MNERTSKADWFLDLALRCSRQGHCLRRNYGAVLVNYRYQIISTGYTGSPSGQMHCSDIQKCWRTDHNIPSGTNYDKCMSVHAEMNALIQAGRDASDGTLYVAGFDVATGEEISGIPCFLCIKLLLNAGVDCVCLRKCTNNWNPELDSAVFKEKLPVVYLEPCLIYRILEKRILS